MRGGMRCAMRCPTPWSAVASSASADTMERTLRVLAGSNGRIRTSHSATTASASPTTNTMDGHSTAASVARQFKHHLNYRHYRENADAIDQNIKNRGASGSVNVWTVVKLHEKFIAADQRLSELRKRRNGIANETKLVIAALKAAQSDAERDELAKRKQDLVDEGRDLKTILAKEEVELGRIGDELYDEARHVPNDSSPDVPVGDESKSITVDMIGSRRMQTAGKALKDHIELAKLHNLADFDRAGKVSGTGFYFLKNAGVLLEMALIRYALDFCVSKGFQPVAVPDVIRHEVIEACGFNPKSSDPQTYFLETHLDAPRKKGYDPMRLCLSATAEFPMAAMHANEVFLPSALPLKMVAIGRAFRAEGLAGAINRGLYRVHQFSKVEMFAMTDKNGSDAMLEEFREIQKQIFEGLELSFRYFPFSTFNPLNELFKGYSICLLKSSVLRLIRNTIWKPGCPLGTIGERYIGLRFPNNILTRTNPADIKLIQLYRLPISEVQHSILGPA
ncbi:hypothetical protein HDU67_008751 [Dinochytrium kinnereticum]|nr:hypothetical protein HDU67_008751 [Dinochytrium kinnereticum]